MSGLEKLYSQFGSLLAKSDKHRTGRQSLGARGWGSTKIFASRANLPSTHFCPPPGKILYPHTYWSVLYCRFTD